MPESFSCPTCGAPLDIDPGMTDPVIRCPYCNSAVVVPAELRSTKETDQPRPLHVQIPGRLLPEQVQEIMDLTFGGNKIGAIKRYRELSQASLKEAKEAVEVLEAGGALPQPSDSHLPVLFKEGMLDEIASRVRAGKKIEAIRLYREVFDVGLKEAKEAVELIERGGLEAVKQAIAQGYRFVQPPVSIISTTNAAKATVATTAAVGTGAGVGGFVLGLIGFILLVTIVPIVFGLAQRGGPLFDPWSKINPFSSIRQIAAFGGEGSGAGLFTDLRYVAVDPQTGNVITAEYGEDGRVQVFNPNGSFLTQWNLGEKQSTIRDLDIDRNGRVFVLFDGDVHRYEAASGQQLDVIEQVNGEDEYFDCVALALDGGWVAVVDSETLVWFDKNDQVLRVLPDAISSITDDPELDVRLALDGLGNLYALGIFNSAVFKFSPEGRYITRFGGDGEEPGQFRAPSTLAVDGWGRVYVSDMKGIQVFDSEGRYLDVFQVNGFPFGLWFSDQNELFIASNDARVYRYAISAP